jgi:hypothetical protein
MQPTDGKRAGYTRLQEPAPPAPARQPQPAQPAARPAPAAQEPPARPILQRQRSASDPGRTAELEEHAATSGYIYLSRQRLASNPSDRVDHMSRLLDDIDRYLQSRQGE